MRFSPDFVERVAEANNIVDIISQYTTLKASGSGHMGRCPFPDHPEKTPSFSVSESKQVYHCFGCHKKGNIFTFLQQYNGMSFPEAIEFLAGRAHLQIPVATTEAARTEANYAEKKRQMAKVNKHACQFFQENLMRLPKSHAVWQYLDKRGLTQEMIDTFAIGYAGEEWDGLLQNLQSKLIPPALAEEARLIKSRAGGKTGHFDLFRDRLMFPIRSSLGDVVAFGGRIILQGEPKYLNSPETLIFHKGRVLYGLFETAKYIRSEDSVVVVEGYMDLVSLYQAGIRNVVATMGTALTLDHGKLLRRLTKNVIVLFDGDSAGQEASERSLPLLLQAELYPRGLTLPDNLDPDDYVKKFGVEQLQSLLAKSGELFPLILSQWMVGYRGEASEKVRLCDRLSPVLNIIQDSRLKQLYVTEAAAKMGVQDRWLMQAISGPTKAMAAPLKAQVDTSRNMPVIGLDNKVESVTEQEPEKIILKGASKAESLLLALVLKNRANFLAFLKSDTHEKILHLGVKKVLERAAGVCRQSPEKFDKLASLLTSFVDLPDILFVPTMMADEEFIVDGVSEQEAKLLQDCLKRVRENFIHLQIQKISQEIKANPEPEKLEQLMSLQRERLSIRQEIKAVLAVVEDELPEN